MKKKVLKILARCGIVIGALIAAAALAFYLLVIAGLSPKLQTIWVCSAMRTMSHQYLATNFIPMDTIQRIMEENAVDDSGYDSEILTFDTEETETESEIPPETEKKTETVHESETEAAETEAESEETGTEPSETETETEPETIPDETESEPETTKETPDTDPYIEEGYDILEEGLYVKQVSGLTWRGYVMLIQDPLRVKLVDTSQQFSCGENVMTMVTNSGAVAGINGGGFQDGANYDSNGGMPAGLLIEDSKLVYPYTADDSTVYNMIGINTNGALLLRHCTSQWALDNGIVSAVSFSPFLVVNGEGLIKNGTGGWGIAPRTAIGQRKTGEFLFLVIDGRQVDWSIGCDLDVLQQVMLDEGAYNAAMLDGGSSTAMVYDGNYINRPSLGHERWINNCFVVTEAEES